MSIFNIQSKTVPVLTALVLGPIIGLLIYFAAKDAGAAAPIAYTGVWSLGLIVYLIVANSHKKIWHWWTTLVILLQVVFIGLALVVERGQSFVAYIYGATMLVSVVMIGLALIGIAEHEINNWKIWGQAFFAYLHKTIEVTVLNAVAGVVVMLLGVLLVMLFKLVGIEINQTFLEIAAAIVLTTVSLLAIALTYDFNKPLSEQEPVLGIVNFFSALGFGLFWVVALFSLVYLIILVPSGFDKILKTGNTLPVLSGLVVVNLVVSYFALFFLARREWTRVNKVVAGFLPTLALVDCVLVGVALYAISVRIKAYGFTFDRYLSVGFVVVLALLLIYLLVAFFVNLLTKRSPQQALSLLKTGGAVALVPLFLVAASPLVVDWEMRGLKNHVARIETNKSWTDNLDRRFVGQIGERAYDYLINEVYPTASPKTKLDIIFLLRQQSIYGSVLEKPRLIDWYGEKNYGKNRPYQISAEDFSAQKLKQLQMVETDSAWKELMKTDGDGSGLEKMDACKQAVSRLIYPGQNISNQKEVDGFCRGNY